jgi:fumarate hydratase class II
LQVNDVAARENLMNSPSVTTALLPYIGYNKAAQLAREMKTKKISILEANRNLAIMDEEKIVTIIEPQNLLKEGFSITEIIEKNGQGKGK